MTGTRTPLLRVPALSQCIVLSAPLCVWLCRLSQQPSVSLFMTLSPLRASCRIVHALVMSMLLGPSSRPGRGDVVSQC